MDKTDAQAVVAKAPVVFDRKRQLMLTAVSAIVVAVAFQAKTMAYNNYNLWRLEFMAIEWLVALAGSFGANLVRDVDERGVAWADSYVPARTGWLYDLLRMLPAAAVRGALVCAFVSIPNATVIPIVIYRETIGNPVIAVLMRFLADVPLAIVLCLAVRAVMEWRLGKQPQTQA